MKKLLKLTTLLLSVSLFLSPVTHTEAKHPDDELVQPLLKRLVEQVILPIYQSLNANAQHLSEDSQDFCKQTDKGGLRTVRESWSATLSGWQQSSVLLFGPATESEIDFTIYFRPVKKAFVKGLLAKASANPEVPLTANIIERVGVGGQGLATLEYLLFDREKDIEQMLASFRDGNLGKQRCSYLIAASALLAENIGTINKDWQPDGGNYAEAFYSAGQGSTHFVETYQPLELLINRFYQTIQAVKLKKLGVPLGKGQKNDEQPQAHPYKLEAHPYKLEAHPYKLEAWRSGHSWQNIVSNLRGMQRLLDSGGILDALRTIGNEELAQQLETELADLLETQLATENLFELLANDPESVTPFYEKIKMFEISIRTDLAPALGIQLGFNDNDGD